MGERFIIYFVITRKNGLKEANSNLHPLTLMDELTLIPNRRGFNRFIKKTLADEKKLRSLAILMLDIDYFKLFNDHYGHLEGDQVIKVVAQNIQQACMDPSVSFSARFGGEEFVIAIFEKERSDVIEIAEVIRNTILNCRIPHQYTLANDFITVSIGVAMTTIRTEAEVYELIDVADETLYEAKQNRRNRFEIR